MDFPLYLFFFLLVLVISTSWILVTRWDRVLGHLAQYVVPAAEPIAAHHNQPQQPQQPQRHTDVIFDGRRYHIYKLGARATKVFHYFCADCAIAFEDSRMERVIRQAFKHAKEAHPVLEAPALEPGSDLCLGELIPDEEVARL